MGPKSWRRIFALLAAFVATAAFTSAKRSPRSDDDEAKVREAATQSAKAAEPFDAIMGAPDKAIPQDLLARAKAGWSDPVFFRAGGGSVGAQLGVLATDFVLLFMNDEAMSGLMKDKFELGAEANIAGGPVGREASAGTDALMQAKILSYSRSHGVFAGVNLKGVVIRPEDDLNYAVYSKSARALLSEDARASGGTAEGLSAFPQAIASGAKTSGTAH
jgi:lipid-binding SYLF domain-containing protein